MNGYKIGTVAQYYSNLGIAIIDLSQSVHVGDLIRVSGSIEFSQTVQLIQVEHEQITSAYAGDTVGVKMIKPVSPGDEIIKSDHEI